MIFFGSWIWPVSSILTTVITVWKLKIFLTNSLSHLSKGVNLCEKFFSVIYIWRSSCLCIRASSSLFNFGNRKSWKQYKYLMKVTSGVYKAGLEYMEGEGLELLLSTMNIIITTILSIKDKLCKLSRNRRLAASTLGLLISVITEHGAKTGLCHNRRSTCRAAWTVATRNRWSWT